MLSPTMPVSVENFLIVVVKIWLRFDRVCR
jgi:hypothetical protein